MFTSTAAIWGVPAGGIVAPIDPIIAWSLVLGCLVVSTAALILGRAATSPERKRQSGPKPRLFDEAA
jgi:predicted MFS family arabinose efflux permease